ncbi:MAG: CBS and ACT domain-containing protein [Desulfobacterales bacterium]|nr:CBS and ACT domain-containing protein [Desulfobacterales bacterium]
MFVTKAMTRDVITINKNTNILQAKEIMAENTIRHLPVVDSENRIVGILTDRDIRSAMPSILLDDYEYKKAGEKLTELLAKDIMSTSPITVSPACTIQDAILLYQKTRHGAFPVVEADGKLIGIVSVQDMLDETTKVMGIGEPGTLLCIIVKERVGELKKIVDIITEENMSIGSVLVSQCWAEGKRAVFPYLFSKNVVPVKRKLKEAGFTLIEPSQWYLDNPLEHG